MEKHIASPRISGDPLAKNLLSFLESNEHDLGPEGSVTYYDYPLFRDDVGTLYRSQVLLATPTSGITIFKLIDGPPRVVTAEKLRTADEELSQLFSLVWSKFLKSPRLRRSRTELAFRVTGVLFYPAGSSPSFRTENVLVTNYDQLRQLLLADTVAPLDSSAWREVRAILEGTNVLLRPSKRDTSPSSPPRALALARIEEAIANFDNEQREASLMLVDGPQRVRGLAGSGKTVVLARKAAHIHLTYPHKTALVTFHTKSLYDFIRLMITRFYRVYRDQDPNFDALCVLHSWGGRNAPGVYYHACVDSGVPPLSLRDVPRGTRVPLAYVCQELLRTDKVKPKYDYVLIDEGQDLPPEFYQLCFALTKGGTEDRNVIWAYDELQDIMDVRVQSVPETFGRTATGEPRMDLERATQRSATGQSHDVVLRKCYRNLPEILVVAHALGFGIYSDQMVQMLENAEHWEDLGYSVLQGEFREGSKTLITRDQLNSPLSTLIGEPPAEIIQTFVAPDFPTEVAWVVSQVQTLLRDGLRPDDIMIICVDDRNLKGYLNAVAAKLSHLEIEANNIQASFLPIPTFLIDNAVTLSSVYKAKGNEAAAVFVMGIDALYPERGLRGSRNRLFTAFTRAKVWLRVSGMGSGAAGFVAEIKTALSRFPNLEFVYPNTARIHTLQRDLSDKAAKVRKLRDQTLKRALDWGLDLDDLSGLFDQAGPKTKV